MKKISLIMLGLAFAFAGLQSFVKDDVATSEKTIITSVDENWSSDQVEGTDELLALGWYMQPCLASNGETGIRCTYSAPGNPPCPPRDPEEREPPCLARN